MWQTIGQPKIIGLLERGLANSNLSHAYLLAGPAQVGKMTLALDLAMALNCAGEKSSRPCGVCSSCQKIAAGKHADVEVIQVLDASQSEDGKAKTEISSEQIKRMIHASFLPPFEGRFRIFIINDAAQTSLEAANRLLKTLEEHQGQAVFILLTAQPGLIPATVVSRCQRLNFARVATSMIEKTLIERWEVEPGRAKLLARLSHGCPGWAIEAARDEGRLTQRAESFERIREVLGADYSQRFGIAQQMAQQFAKKREAVYEILASWLNWWHDLLMVKAGCSGDIINLDYLPALGEMARTYRLAQVRKAIEAVRAASDELKLNANARLALEFLMLELPEPTPATSGTMSGVKNA
jgi:DNA polymerase-3 subunit delta'